MSMPELLHRFIDALKAFKVVFLHGKKTYVDIHSHQKTQLPAKEGDDNDLLANLGYFADGTPLNTQSFKAWKKLDVNEKVKRNSECLRERLVKWDTLVEKPLKSNPGRHYFVFLHVPKAGGTTLEHIIAKNYLPNQFIHANGPAIDDNPSIIFNAARQHPRGLVMGHYQRNSSVYQFLSDRPIIHFTMLRDPIKRVPPTSIM